MAIASLEALVDGPSSSTGTLVLHGAGGSPERNFPFLDRLARGGRIVAPYYPGTGPSPRASRDLHVDELVDQAVAAADTAGLDQFDVLGYSLGTALAARLATRHAHRVKRLVLTAGLARASTSLRLACGVWTTLLDGDPLALGQFVAWAASSEQAWRHRADDATEIAHTIAASVPAGTAEQADLVRRVDVRADLGHIAVPTLVVVTRHDRFVDPAHSAELAAGIPGARMVELDGGHDIASEAAEAWWDVVAEHFDLTGGAQRCA